jgi:hypothetical protein
VPLTPAPLDWPRSARTGLPLHFLLQVDCAQVAPRARLTVLPGSGALLFFADLTGTPGHDTPAEGRVIWIDESDEATWTEADPPADLPPPMPVSGRKAAPSLALGSRCAGCATSVATLALRTHGHRAACGADARTGSAITWPDGPTTADALLAAQGTPVAVFALSPNDFNLAGNGQMDRPGLASRMIGWRSRRSWRCSCAKRRAPRRPAPAHSGPIWMRTPAAICSPGSKANAPNGMPWLAPSRPLPM